VNGRSSAPLGGKPTVLEVEVSSTYFLMRIALIFLKSENITFVQNSSIQMKNTNTVSLERNNQFKSKRV
jgi:hypothetical protein